MKFFKTFKNPKNQALQFTFSVRNLKKKKHKNLENRGRKRRHKNRKKNQAYKNEKKKQNINFNKQNLE